MTDVILQDKQGQRTHYFVGDNRPAIVYVRKDGTLRVRRLSRHLEERLVKLLEGLSQH